MNARQKAKRYKRLYEQSRYKFTAPIFPSTKHDIVKIAVKQTVSSDMLYDTMNQNAETPMKAVEMEIARMIGKEVLKYCDVKIEPSAIPYHADLVCRIRLIDEIE